jgi:hypothetical protein
MEVAIRKLLRGVQVLYTAATDVSLSSIEGLTPRGKIKIRFTAVCSINNPGLSIKGLAYSLVRGNGLRKELQANDNEKV